VKMYHGTTEEAWEEIQKEGVLWGRKNQFWCGNKMDRINWLASKKKFAGIYDNRGITKQPCVILEIDMPEIKEHKYWEYVTYDPIPISRIRRVQ
jgi:RNA:NAD 2'-phosphotransferase (TPT1/KptA family)